MKGFLNIDFEVSVVMRYLRQVNAFSVKKTSDNPVLTRCDIKIWGAKWNFQNQQLFSASTAFFGAKEHQSSQIRRSLSVGQITHESESFDGMFDLTSATNTPKLEFQHPLDRWGRRFFFGVEGRELLISLPQKSTVVKLELSGTYSTFSTSSWWDPCWNHFLHTLKKF